MWCKIKELVLRKPKNVIKTVIHENIEYKEDTQMVTIFDIIIRNFLYYNIIYMFLEFRFIGLNEEKKETIDMFIIKRLSIIYVYIY